MKTYPTILRYSQPVLFNSGTRTVLDTYTGKARANFHNTSDPGNDLNFEVCRSPIQYMVVPPAGDYMRNAKMNESHQWDILYNRDTGLPLGIHSQDYTLVQNEELFQVVEEQIINAFDPSILDNIEVKDSVQKNGAVCIRQYIFPGKSRVIKTNSGHESEIRFRAIAWNCFNGDHKVKIIFGDIDMFCSNGMISGEYSTVTGKRSKNFDLSKMKKPLEVAFSRFDDRIDQYQKWALMDVNVDHVDEFFDKIGGGKILSEQFKEDFRDEIATRGRNLWSVVSTLSRYSTHTLSNRTLSPGNRDMLTQETNQKKVSRWLKGPHFEHLQLNSFHHHTQRSPTRVETIVNL